MLLLVCFAARGIDRAPVGPSGRWFVSFVRLFLVCSFVRPIARLFLRSAVCLSVRLFVPSVCLFPSFVSSRACCWFVGLYAHSLAGPLVYFFACSLPCLLSCFAIFSCLLAWLLACHLASWLVDWLCSVLLVHGHTFDSVCRARDMSIGSRVAGSNCLGLGQGSGITGQGPEI